MKASPLDLFLYFLEKRLLKQPFSQQKTKSIHHVEIKNKYVEENWIKLY